VFNPLTWVVAEGLELRTHPLVSIASPNVVAKWEHWRGADGRWAVAGEYGLSMPAGALRWPLPVGVAGYLTPSCKVAARGEAGRDAQCQAPGWFLVPRVGALATYLLGQDAAHALTARADFAYGVRLAGLRPAPLDSFPYLDVLMAPVFNTYRARLGVRYDHQWLPWLRAAVEVDVYRIGEGPAPARDPWLVSVYVGLDARLTDWMRLTAGAMYWNSDQRRRVLKADADGFSTWEAARSHDVVPTLDMLWTW
jgi:hypothetical protein